MLIYLHIAYGHFYRELSRYEGDYMAYKDQKNVTVRPFT